jgi:hypothetical protein
VQEVQVDERGNTWLTTSPILWKKQTRPYRSEWWANLTKADSELGTRVVKGLKTRQQ